MNLATKYLGLDLDHPFVVGASPLARTLDGAKRAEDAGASAIVLHSLFEEQFTRYQEGLEENVHAHEEAFGEATSYFTSAVSYHFGPEQYLEHLNQLKQALGIPVIASLNGTHPGGWANYSKYLADAGADALELNLYFQPTSVAESSAEVEKRLIEVVKAVRGSVGLPLSVKLSPFFTSLPQMAAQLKDAGADALVLFNRFYQPDIDLEELETVPTLKLSTPDELLLRLRWIAMLYGRFDLELAVTGGVHSAQDAAKAVMSGADVVQLVSCLLTHGYSLIGQMRDGFNAWLEENEYESLAQLKGSMSYLHAPQPEAIERANYLKILQSWA